MYKRQVVAPLTEQSGSGGSTTPGGAPAATPGLTTSTSSGSEGGYPVLAAVHGTPADSVKWALEEEKLYPDLVLSGINEGQNYGILGNLFSGTVGAARQAAKLWVHSIATSQEIGVHPDFPAGVTATLQLLEEWRIGASGTPHMEVPSINIPTCSAGSVRATADGTGLLRTVVDLTGRAAQTSDCLSVVAEGDIEDDVHGVGEGFATVADMTRNELPLP